jgi:hypothetical protein
MKRLILVLWVVLVGLWLANRYERQLWSLLIHHCPMVWKGDPDDPIKEQLYICRENGKVAIKAHVYYIGREHLWHGYAFDFWRTNGEYDTLEEAKKAMEKAVN